MTPDSNQCSAGFGEYAPILLYLFRNLLGHLAGFVLLFYGKANIYYPTDKSKSKPQILMHLEARELQNGMRL